MKLVALCRTYYHIVQVLALSQWIQETSTLTDLTIYRGKSILKEFSVEKSALELSSLPYPVRLVDLPNPQVTRLPLAVIRLIFSSLLTRHPRLALATPNGPHLGLLTALAKSGMRPQVFYSFEEGIGTYGSTLHRARIRAAHSRKPHHLPLYLSGELIKRTLLYITTLRSGGIIETLSTRPGSEHGIRIPLAPYVKGVLSSGVFRLSGESLPNNTVLLISQPLVEAGIIDEESYLAVLESARGFFERAGNHFFIKPHPAESVEKLCNFNICQFEGPVEALFSHNKKKLAAVAGINSTAMIIARRLFEIKAYRIEHRLLYARRRTSNPAFRELLYRSTELLRLPAMK